MEVDTGTAQNAIKGYDSFPYALLRNEEVQ